MAVSQKDRQQYALQVIFSFFLGLMVLAFIGIGVNTFYTQPATYDDPAMQELYREQDRIYQKERGESGLSAEDEARIDELQTEIDALQASNEEVRQTWARNTSIILILFATLVMGVSLVRSDQLRVISNGLLLGGLFTMVYGVGWIIFSGESIARFAVIVFALLVTIALGYLRFVQGREAEAVTGGAPAPVSGRAGGPIALDDGAVASLAERVDALERRTAAAAMALGIDAHDGPHERSDEEPYEA